MLIRNLTKTAYSTLILSNSSWDSPTDFVSSYFRLNGVECRLFNVQSYRTGEPETMTRWRRSPVFPHRFHEEFNLQGNELTFYTLDWSPWLTLQNCNDNGTRGCKPRGIVADLMENLAKMYNFTPVYYTEPSNEWGGYENGMIEGAFAKMVSGQSDR